MRFPAGNLGKGSYTLDPGASVHRAKFSYGSERKYFQQATSQGPHALSGGGAPASHHARPRGSPPSDWNRAVPGCSHSKTWPSPKRNAWLCEPFRKSSLTTWMSVPTGGCVICLCRIQPISHNSSPPHVRVPHPSSQPTTHPKGPKKDRVYGVRPAAQRVKWLPATPASHMGTRSSPSGSSADPPPC